MLLAALLTLSVIWPVNSCASKRVIPTDVTLLPKDLFVSLSTVDPTIVIEMRYFGAHNFLGRPVAGYHAGKCLLTQEAAKGLSHIQTELRKHAVSLKVYDCYRPQQAVNDFVAWSKDPKDIRTKKEFYPLVDKKDVFKLGYVASKSGHSRGSTVDLTLVPLPVANQAAYRDGQSLFECFLPVAKRFGDNSLDMGTGYDCFDERAATRNSSITDDAKKNRLFLLNTMEKFGFKNYEGEWWHYTLRDEPFPETYFDFPVE